MGERRLASWGPRAEVGGSGLRGLANQVRADRRIDSMFTFPMFTFMNQAEARLSALGVAVSR